MNNFVEQNEIKVNKIATNDCLMQKRKKNQLDKYEEKTLYLLFL